MREGNLNDEEVAGENYPQENLSGKISMVSRLATFIGAATAELEAAYDQLELTAMSDGLTKLLNRSEIQKRIETRLRTEKKPFALIMLDIDCFKRINDTCGHTEGDNVIIALANLLKLTAAEFEPKGNAGRWGGEEFMLFLPDKTAESAFEIAEKIRKEFAAMNFEKTDSVTVSVGVTAAIDGENADVLYNRVDGALYEAKQTGKNKTVLR
jgi:diguanylate cyclase (GGDEF)-like protein